MCCCIECLQPVNVSEENGTVWSRITFTTERGPKESNIMNNVIRCAQRSIFLLIPPGLSSMDSLSSHRY